MIAITATTMQRRHVLFGTFCLLVAVGHVTVLGALFEYSTSNVAASHVLLIPVVAAVLIYSSRDIVFASVRFAWPLGLGTMVGGLGLALLSSPSQFPAGQGDGLTLPVAAMVTMWLGGFLFSYGHHAFRAALFPLLFLGFMIPFPEALLDGLVVLLKTWSTETVAGLFTLTGTPYYREGFLFTLPTVAIEIADECSGIRSSIALLLTSLLAGHTFLKKGWSKATLVMAVLPITVVKNGIRIVGLSLLAIHVDSGFLTGQLHHEGGVVFFLLALGILGPILALLRRAETA